MPDPDPKSLLNDILAASTQPRGPAQAPRQRTGFDDLLRLNDADWNRFLLQVAPDDLVVICKAAGEPWRTRVVASLDDVSRTWIQNNVDALDEVSPALLAEASGRALEAAKRLIRDQQVTLPAAPAGQPAAAASPAPAAERAPAAPKPAPPAKPAVPKHDPVSVSFAPPTFIPPDEPKAPAKPAPSIDRVTVSFGTGMPPVAATPTPATTAATASPGHEQELDALFADLLRLRQHSGAGSLAPLAKDVADPFLQHGLALVASGLSAAELERALDHELARQAEAYIEHLTRLRTGLLALARGEA